MSNTINSSMDYSSLFSSLPKTSESSGGNLTTLATEFSSIRSGSYKKLLSSYYEKMKKEDTTEATKKENSNLQLVSGNATSLKDAASAVSKLDFSKDSAEDITKAMKTLVSSYNSVIDTADDVEQKGVLRNTLWMTNIMQKSAGLLSDVGITIGENNKLSFDETKWGEASSSTKIALFNGRNSLADKLSYKASQINTSAAQGVSNTASAYKPDGDYTKVSTESMYNAFM